MKTLVYGSYEAMCEAIASRIADKVRNKPDALLCLAAGHTSLGVFRAMGGLADAGEVSFDRCRFIGLDEWAGLGRGDDGSCIDFMYRNLFIPLGIAEERIIFYDGRGDLEAECGRIDAFVEENGPVDFMLLGMGMNGHLGLNEPGTPFDRYSHVVELDETTKTVGQKYFRKARSLSGGITMGMLHIRDAAEVVLAVSGGHKAPVVKRLLAAEPDESLPASYLLGLDGAFLALDREAAGDIDEA